MRDSLIERSDEQHIGSDVYVGSDTYISWAVTNLGPQSINQSFFVDLYFNGVMVQRWRNEKGVSRNGFYIIDGWVRLPELITPFSSTHILTLVVDPTNLVLETDETDNTFELTFDWLEPSGSLPPPVPSGLFDLAPQTPEGWSGEIVATSIIDDTISGNLSTNLRTYISYAFTNVGDDVPESTVIPVYLYFDDLLVDVEYLPGIPASKMPFTVTWSGLHDAVDVSEGSHRLRIEIDPLNTVLEVKESNNTRELEFVWGLPAVAP